MSEFSDPIAPIPEPPSTEMGSGQRWVAPFHRTPESLMSSENVILTSGQEFEIDTTKEAFTPEQAGLPRHSHGNFEVFIRGRVTIGNVPVWIVEEKRASDGTSHFSLTGPQKDDGSRSWESLGRGGKPQIVGREGDITGQMLTGNEFDRTVSRKHVSIELTKDRRVFVTGMSVNPTQVEARRVPGSVPGTQQQQNPEATTQSSWMELHVQQNIARAKGQISAIEAEIETIRDSIDHHTYALMWRYASDASSAEDILYRNPNDHKAYELRMGQASDRLNKIPQDQRINARNLATYLTNRNNLQRVLNDLQAKEVKP